MTEEIRGIYTSVWQLHKRFYDIRTDEEWEMLNAECSNLIKNNNTDFTRLLIQAMISEITNR